MKAAGEKIRDIETFINQSPELADARENGVDLWALWHNLQRTPAERMRRHDMALNTYLELQREGIISAYIEPDDSGLTVDHLLHIKELMNTSGIEAVRQLEAIKKMRE